MSINGKLFKEIKLELDTKNVDKLLDGLKKSIENGNPFVVIRILQSNYPTVWDAIKQVAKDKHVEENTDFLDRIREFYANPGSISLDSINKNFIANETINIDDDLKTNFTTQLDAGDDRKTKHALNEITQYIAKLFVDSIITKSDFKESFKKAWSSSPTTGLKK